MPSDIAISVRGLNKAYSITHQREKHSTFTEAVLDRVRHPFRKTPRETFHALKDVNFEIEKGEIVGIIGRNGAGKSTLLKILSRITEPTSGEIDLHGRVGSLLEVGTGFHPELTGRENIFLNGAILGMARGEIVRQLDEIVSFADIERFLDTPVKRYSSGMYVRLAFAVAAHLSADILIIDEVLAVGDIAFQKKCMGKMEQISTKNGRTVLLVSHQLGIVMQLCRQTILLDRGAIVQFTDTQDSVNAYLDQGAGGKFASYVAPTDSERKDIYIIKADCASKIGVPTNRFSHMDEIAIRITCRINKWVPGSELRLVVKNNLGRVVFTSDAILEAKERSQTNTLTAIATIPPTFLRPDSYSASLATFVPHQCVIDSAPEALSFTVFDAGSKYAASEGVDYGCVFGNCHWVMDYSLL